MIKVSVIIPVYNVEEYIEKCIKSIINQSLKEIEIILINDGSPDNSQNIIDLYQKKDNRIISIIKKNGGQGSARNEGLRIARGEYIVFVDSDDWIDEKMLEVLYNKAKQDNCDIVVSNAYKVYGNRKVKYDMIMTSGENDIDTYMLNGTGPLAKLIKRDLIIDNKLFFPEKIIYEDYACIPLYGLFAKKISYVNKYFYYYLIRENSTMTQNFNLKFYDILKASEILYNKSSAISENYKEVFEFLIVENLLRDTYFRLKDIKESKYLLLKARDYIEKIYPKFLKNKYIKNKGFKYKMITYLIYKQKYKILNLINKI